MYGKGSLFGKMPGDDWQKLAGVRSMFAYQWAHPGKKLSFMGNELAQWGEWDHDASIDWDCLNWQEHRQVQTMVADLNAFYKAHPALWSQDFDPAGFQWLTSDDADHNTLSFLRIGTKGETLAVVVNFSGEAWSDYQVALPTGGRRPASGRKCSPPMTPSTAAPTSTTAPSKRSRANIIHVRSRRRSPFRLWELYS